MLKRSANWAHFSDMHKQMPIKRLPLEVISRRQGARHGATPPLAARLHKHRQHMLIKPSELTKIFKALGNANRLAIVERLSVGPASVMEVANLLPITEPAVVEHMQKLEASGLVQSDKATRVRICRLNSEKLRIAEDWIADRRKSVRRRPDWV
jgi:DNA-binding transcriptional ArsR family regulator